MILGPAPTPYPSALVLHSIEPPDGPVQAVHAHADVETVVRVVEGIVYLVLEDDERVLTPGDEARIPAGAPYRRWNAGDEHAHVVEIHRPVASARRGDSERLAA
jgi:mannose-6-phosphate isomerase-like protein (cupin superfamily)